MKATRGVYGGLFAVSLGTVMYEILLTRIFSVTMYYHFAFVAISIAMFGMTVGALVVYLLADRFPPEKTLQHLAVSATALPVAMVLSFMTQLSIPFLVHPSLVAIYAVGLTYAVIAVPFVVSGIAVTLALTRFPLRVGQLYAADLVGAALGCVLLVFVLGWTDGPTAVFVVAFFTSLGAVSFAAAAGSPTTRRVGVAVAILLGVFVTGHTALVHRQFPILRILYIKGALEARPLYEKWNSYSRVRVNGDPNELTEPYGWGLSTTIPPDRRYAQLKMDIDVNAGTVITKYTGRPDEIDHLTYDVTNIGYNIRPDGKVLVVGTGGGRDILSALAFGAREVVGVEINKAIIETVNDRFGDFSGHLDRNPRVRFVNDEARSYIARQREQYDFLQISLIDTWAATAAGAFVLSENALYTVEAWQVFLSHLTPHGVLSVSRWYVQDRPGEVYRMLTLATASLARVGVSAPRGNLMLVRSTGRGQRGITPDGVGTLLVSRTPFSDADIDRIEEASSHLGFEVVLSPRHASDPNLAQLASGGDQSSFIDAYPLKIAAPTDDSPFFFQMLRMRDLLRFDLMKAGKSSANITAVFVLGTLLATVTILSALCIVLPLWLTTGTKVLAGRSAFLWFFAAIGTGFMLIETSQMQRLIIVLGHPTYGLSVVLFALLLASGVGSYFSGRIRPGDELRQATVRLSALLGLLVVFGLATPWLVSQFEASSTPVRIAVAVAILAPPGFLMGMAFPLGMRLASSRAPSLTPWLWGVNGALSVCASVLSVAIALTWAISAAFWVGVAAYGVALVSYRRAARVA